MFFKGFLTVFTLSNVHKNSVFDSATSHNLETSKRPPFEAAIMKQFNQKKFSVLTRDRDKEFRHEQNFLLLFS